MNVEMAKFTIKIVTFIDKSKINLIQVEQK